MSSTALTGNFAPLEHDMCYLPQAPPTHLPLAPSVLILAGTLCQKVESLAGNFAPLVHRQLSKTH